MFCIAPGMSTTPPPSEDRWDVQRRFIRIVQEHDNGMVEFEFAVGEPELFVEMVMPRAQFDEFCAMQGVQPTHSNSQFELKEERAQAVAPLSGPRS